MRALFNERFLLRFAQLFTGIALISLVFGLVWTILRPSEISVTLPPQQEVKALQNAFLQKKEAYENIGAPWLSLKEAPPPLLLPDLKSVLTYHGMNGRPDASQEHPLLHMGLQGSKEVTLVAQGERFFVDYRRGRAGEESYSLTKEERPLWIEVEPHEQEALVKVGLSLEGHQPLESQTIRVAQKELARYPFGAQGWEIGKYRADGTLLARQQAKWVGTDCFLAERGGEEYAEFSGKHRLDFGENEEAYSVYVGLSDCLVFSDNQWKRFSPGEETKGLPLLQVKRIDERIMALDLWDPTGQKKIPLTLIKAQETWAKENLQKDFRFVGAKTRTQCVFEIGCERHLLKPQDWLVQTDNGWQKLESIEDIDDYVERRISGPLFVFDGFVKEDDHQVLMGTLYNASRTDSCPIQLAIQRGGVTILPAVEEAVATTDSEEPFIEIAVGGGR